jgi:hypothetical protein
MTNNSLKDSKYRLYYNSDGSPKFYSMEDLPGEYIFIDHQTFEQGRYDIVVRHGRILSLSDSGTSRYVQVVRATPNSVKCDISDITILTESSEHILWDYRSNQ